MDHAHTRKHRFVYPSLVREGIPFGPHGDPSDENRTGKMDLFSENEISPYLSKNNVPRFYTYFH